MRRPLRLRARVFVALACGLAPASPAAAAKIETWRQDSASAFNKGKRERVVVSDTGRVRLGRAVRPTAPLDAAHVWDLVRSKDGGIYAATGDAGKVFRRAGKDGDWSVIYDADDTQALALAALPDGRVFAGTGPSGQVVEVTDPKHPASRPDPSVQYIWDLASDASGSLYAATGPNGQLWKRRADGSWSLVLDSKHPHLLCLAIAPDGTVYAGSDGEGLVYRVAPGGAVSVVYDAPQNEVRSLLIGPDGVLYAGTAAAEGGAPGGTGRGLARSDSASGPSLAGAGRDDTGGDGAITAAIAAQTRGENRSGGPSQPPPGGTASPRPPAPGENAVYRIGPDGAAREIFRARVMVFALAWQSGRLLIGTGPEGQIYEVRDGRETTPIARLDHGQALSLLSGENNADLLIGTGDPGAVVSLAATHEESGTLTSDVLDTRLISRFGALTWRAERPPGTALTLQVRSGNVGEPDETWSAWSPPQDDPASAGADQVPPGRFVQYRAVLATNDPNATPELRSVALRYQTLNLAPELTKLDVPDLSEGDGATRQNTIALKWEASDPNGDDLAYTLHIRKEGWPDWIRLGDRPLTEKTYSWDASAVPAGTYRVRITASDRPSNPPGEALTRELTSEPFLVDHLAPVVAVKPTGKGANVQVEDTQTRLVKAAYALDGGEWVAVFPTDGLFDTLRETIAIDLPDLKPGTHVLMVRVTDAAGNTGAGDAVFVVE
jgi:hypothetical protein